MILIRFKFKKINVYSMIYNRTKVFRIYYILIFYFISFINSNAQIIDTGNFVITVTIPSKVMNTKHKAMVFLPEDYYTDKDSFPTVYLLHGYTGYYNNWYVREPGLAQYAIRYNMIIVTPEGTSDSWYIDSPLDTLSRYETYIAREVPDWIDKHFKTKNRRENRAICGLSMGGHGALTIAADYQDRFGAASSMSGVLDFRPFGNKWNLIEILGDFNKFPDNWFDYSFVGKISDFNTKTKLAIFIDCGMEDPFFEVNQEIHEELVQQGIPHDFIVRPGGHSWDYWKNALPYHLLFFQIYFNKEK